MDKATRATRLRLLTERAEARRKRLRDVYQYAESMALATKRSAIYAEANRLPTARTLRQSAVEWCHIAHERFIKQREYDRDVKLARSH